MLIFWSDTDLFCFSGKNVGTWGAPNRNLEK